MNEPDLPDIVNDAQEPDVVTYPSGATLSGHALTDEFTLRRTLNGKAGPMTLGRASLVFAPGLAEPLPPVTYAIRAIGMVDGPGAPHLVAGYGFTGKTLALQSLVLSLVAHRPAWGVYTADRPYRCVHVDLEQGFRLTARRYQRLASAYGIELSELGDALAVANMPRINLHPAHRHEWKDLMVKRDILVVDSLRAATPGGEENNSSIRESLDLLGSLSEETGCRAIVIHHARKPQKDEPAGKFSIRGSSGIYDAIDACYIFTAEKGEAVLVENAKARSHGELADDFALQISDVREEGKEPGLSVRVHGSELVQEQRDKTVRTKLEARARIDSEKVRDVVQRQPGILTTELRALCGINGARLTMAKRHLGLALEERAAGTGTAIQHFLRGAS